MASSFAVPAREFEIGIRLHVQIGKPEKDDLRALIETDLHERILTRLRCDDSVNAAGFADP